MTTRKHYRSFSVTEFNEHFEATPSSEKYKYLFFPCTIEVAAEKDTDSLESAAFLYLQEANPNPWLGNCSISQFSIHCDLGSVKNGYFILNSNYQLHQCLGIQEKVFPSEMISEPCYYLNFGSISLKKTTSDSSNQKNQFVSDAKLTAWLILQGPGLKSHAKLAREISDALLEILVGKTSLEEVLIAFNCFFKNALSLFNFSKYIDTEFIQLANLEPFFLLQVECSEVGSCSNSQVFDTFFENARNKIFNHLDPAFDWNRCRTICIDYTSSLKINDDDDDKSNIFISRPGKFVFLIEKKAFYQIITSKKSFVDFLNSHRIHLRKDFPFSMILLHLPVRL